MNLDQRLTKIEESQKRILKLLTRPEYLTAQEVKAKFGLSKKKLQVLRNGRKDPEGNYIENPVLKDYKELNGRNFIYNKTEIEKLFKQ